VRLGPPQLGDVLKLLRMKSGMNPLGMSFLLPFLQRVGEQWGFDSSFTTGEFGTFTMPEPAPPVALNGLADLVRFLILQGRRLPLELVERLTMLDAADIRDEIRRHVSAYPESNLTQKLAHFVLYERAFKWHTEAEDRNRCFFWTTSPFIDLQFFRFAMSCPDVQKRYYRLYREFLLGLSADAAAIDHAGYGLPITSEKFELVAKAASFLSQQPRATAHLAAPSDTYSGESMVIRALSAQLDSCSLLDEYLARPLLQQIVRQPREYATDRIDLLFTVTSAIELLGTGRSVMESVAGDSQ
jgi:asparagine synthase (glutamine-hydrolysing)